MKNEIRVRNIAADMLDEIETLLSDHLVYLPSADREEAHIAPLRMRAIAKMLLTDSGKSYDDLLNLGLTENEIDELTGKTPAEDDSEACLYGDVYDDLESAMVGYLVDAIEEGRTNSTATLNTEEY